MEILFLVFYSPTKFVHPLDEFDWRESRPLLFQCDLAKDGLVNSTEQMDAFCQEKGFVKWFETSAKENINIEAAARFLITEVTSLN